MAARWIIIPHLMYVIMQVTVTTGTSYADGDMVEDDWTGTGTGYSRVHVGTSGVKWMTCLALVI